MARCTPTHASGGRGLLSVRVGGEQPTRRRCRTDDPDGNVLAVSRLAPQHRARSPPSTSTSRSRFGASNGAPCLRPEPAQAGAPTGPKPYRLSLPCCRRPAVAATSWGWKFTRSHLAASRCGPAGNPGDSSVRRLPCIGRSRSHNGSSTRMDRSGGRAMAGCGRVYLRGHRSDSRAGIMGATCPQRILVDDSRARAALVGSLMLHEHAAKREILMVHPVLASGRECRCGAQRVCLDGVGGLPRTG
jgi:hypothetical protein